MVRELPRAYYRYRSAIIIDHAWQQSYWLSRRALDGEFTNSRGTTRVVPGSRHWPVHHAPAKPSESIGAEMKRGSALIYTGRTYHGAGANSTDTTRTALNIAYNSSFLKQECNSFISAPPSLIVARRIPPLLQELLGYAGADAAFVRQAEGLAAPARL
jgi:ectoine hydroxylase-related dioxygenase (phytanoyl-CoA dioxygenase family)